MADVRTMETVRIIEIEKMKWKSYTNIKFLVKALYNDLYNEKYEINRN
jgi:hypothetical protein